ncbi:hypothetical protein ACHAWF_017051 [Thalassiosira exigua]
MSTSGAAETGATPSGPAGAGAAASASASASGAAASRVDASGPSGAANTASSTAPSTRELHQVAFYESMRKIEESRKESKATTHLSQKKYDDAIDLISNWTEGVQGRAKSEYRWHKKFEVDTTAAKNSALRLKANRNVKIAITEELFDIIARYHVNDQGHARTARTQYIAIKKEFYGIAEKEIQTFIDCCPTCMASRKKISAKQQPLKMMRSETIGRRVQMDLIDMTSQPDPVTGDKWILRVVDHLSTYGSSDALKAKEAKLVAPKVVRALTHFPECDILQSDNGGEFLGATVKLVNR